MECREAEEAGKLEVGRPWGHPASLNQDGNAVAEHSAVAARLLGHPEVLGIYRGSAFAGAPCWWLGRWGTGCLRR
jgi:hypothetical protein